MATQAKDRRRARVVSSPSSTQQPTRVKPFFIAALLNKVLKTVLQML